MLAENVRGLGNQPVGTAGAGGEHFLGLEQRFAQREGLLPLARRHLFVPHTRRQPIGLPDRGHHHDFHVETKIGGHFPHPGGALGRKLLTHVRDVMQADVPTLDENVPVPVALAAMTRGGMGMAVVLAATARITGIFTDGDLRRALERLGDLRTIPVSAVMTRNPRSIGSSRLAVEAVEMMEANKINQLLVIDDAGALCGALNMHDLFRAKVV